jgi:hypothetical protein
MSLGRIDRIIDAVRHGRYRFSPARRVYIPKRNGKLRPLGLPTWSDKGGGRRSFADGNSWPRMTQHRLLLPTAVATLLHANVSTAPAPPCSPTPADGTPLVVPPAAAPPATPAAERIGCFLTAL